LVAEARATRRYARLATPEFLVTEEALDADRHVIAFRGEIDLISAQELRQKLTGAIKDGKTRIVVDLTDTTYLDDIGLGVFMAAWKKLRARGGALVFVNVDPKIAKTFEITGLDELFAIRDTRDAAIAALDDATSPSS